MAWYDDRTLVAGFGSALIDAEVLQDSNEYKNFMQKPMKYNEYYAAWEATGYPSDEEDDGWEEFIEAISNDEDEPDET